ncbi:thioredoxin family protein [Oceanicaulis alexandrii]|uniref:thioredoxin domain-containing protein n=1 Tax=Oceanicaulis alexandrii TaxID=153233 RepID=UPI0035D02ABE
MGRRLLAALFLILLPASAEAGIRTDEPRLVAALFRSNWCGPCKVLEPRYEAVMADYAAAPLERVRFDSSFGRRGVLARRAREEGVSQAYEATAGSTGFVLLIDRETGDVLARISMAYSDADIRGALDHALQVIADREAFGL